MAIQGLTVYDLRSSRLGNGGVDGGKMRGLLGPVALQQGNNNRQQQHDHAQQHRQQTHRKPRKTSKKSNAKQTIKPIINALILLSPQ